MIFHRLQHHSSLHLLILVTCLCLLTFTGRTALAADGGGSVGVASTSVDFGTVVVGDTATRRDTIINRMSRPVTIKSIQGQTAAFQISGISLPIVLGAGEKTDFLIHFHPADNKAATATTIAFEGPSALPYVTLLASGKGILRGRLSTTPSPVSFTNVPVGTTASTNLTLTNYGDSDLTIQDARLNGAAFSMSNMALPLVLGAGQSTQVTVTFAPTRYGSFRGGIAFVTKSGIHFEHIITVPVALMGFAVSPGALTLTPSRLSFGSIEVGKSSSQSAILANNGGSSITISQAGTTAAGFSVSGLALPLTLNAGQSASVTVAFAPKATGTVNGNVVIGSNDTNAILSLTVSGMGVAAGSLSPSPASANFGSVAVGSNQSMPVTIANTGGETVTVSAASATGSGFKLTGATLPMTLNAGQSATLNVVFTPASAGAATGSLIVTSNASNANLSIPLAGTGVTPGQLVSAPTSFSFGNIQVGTSKSLPGTLTNSGGSSVTISAATVSTGFSLGGLTLPLTLNAGQSASFTVQFAPTAGGAVSGNINITSNGSNTSLSVAVTGTGVTAGALTANPTSQNFGSVKVGSSATLSQTLTNSGGSAITISAAAATGTGFSLTGLAALPITLNAGQSTSFTVQFAPTAGGAASGNINITSNGSNTALSVALTGSGVTLGTLNASPTSQSFGSVQVGSSASLSQTLTNSGGSAVTISAATATGTGFSLSGLALPMTLNAGQSTSFTVVFSPTAGGAASGNLNLTSNATNSSLSVALSGTGLAVSALAATPASLAFGNVQAGSTAHLSETLTNSGSSSVTITQANLSGAGYSVSGLTLPVTLTANQTVQFTVSFAPTAAGAVNRTLAIVSNASNSTLNISLSGTGTAPGSLSVAPASLSFGNTTVGSSSALTGSITATGSSVTINSAGVNNGAFTLSGITLPMTLNAGQSYTYTVTFAPQSSGAASASLTFASTASNASTVETMSGSGTAPVQHSVGLSWNSANSAVGYNVYRSTTSGGPYTMINSSMTTSTSYMDSTVVGGQTYYYVATSVDSSSNESGYSSQTKAVVPNP